MTKVKKGWPDSRATKLDTGGRKIREKTREKEGERRAKLKIGSKVKIRLLGFLKPLYIFLILKILIYNKIIKINKL